MRLTFWQQFSSNHSASFTVVGQFETVERAEQVAEELRQILRKIEQWWMQWDEQRKIERKLRKQGKLTPPEEAFRDHYGVGWTQYPADGKAYPLDWSTSEAVHVFRNVVLIHPNGNTWAGSKPFDVIMQSLGGKVAKKVEDDLSSLVVDVTCVATDEITAKSIEQTVTRPKSSANIQFVRFPGFGNVVPGELRRDGIRLIFTNVFLRWAGLRLDELEAFQQIIVFLESLNCTDIQYTFHELPYT